MARMDRIHRHQIWKKCGSFNASRKSDTIFSADASSNFEDGFREKKLKSLHVSNLFLYSGSFVNVIQLQKKQEVEGIRNREVQMFVESGFRGRISGILGPSCFKSDENWKTLHGDAYNIFDLSVKQLLPYVDLEFDATTCIESISAKVVAEFSQFVEIDNKNADKKTQNRID